MSQQNGPKAGLRTYEQLIEPVKKKIREKPKIIHELLDNHNEVSIKGRKMEEYLAEVWLFNPDEIQDIMKCAGPKP